MIFSTDKIAHTTIRMYVYVRCVYHTTQKYDDGESRSIIRRSMDRRNEIVAVEMKLEIGGNGDSLRGEVPVAFLASYDSLGFIRVA